MPATDKLNDPLIRNAKPREKAFKLSDGGGMYLEVMPIGSKLWRLKYRFGGKEKRLSLGAYPEVSLREARAKRAELRRQLDCGKDPSVVRRVAQAEAIVRSQNTFEVIARRWYAMKLPGWAPAHAERVLSRLERDVFPMVGTLPIGEVTPRMLLLAMRKIEARGVIETAHRALQDCSQVFRYAVAEGLLQSDPSRDLRGALPPVKSKHFSAVTDAKGAKRILQAIYGYDGSAVVRAALRFAPLTFVRPGELRSARWADIDFDSAEWRFTVSKTETPHIVPLSRQAMDVLKGLHPVTGHGAFVFPNERGGGRPMSENAVLMALRTLGIGKDEMTGHGFRAMARTILDEVLGERPDLIEHQLAHAVRDPNGRAYNRTAHLPERRRMMQRWADYLDELRADGTVGSSKCDKAHDASTPDTLNKD